MVGCGEISAPSMCLYAVGSRGAARRGCCAGNDARGGEGPI